MELVCVQQEGSSGLCLLAELSRVFKELQRCSAGGHKEGLDTYGAPPAAAAAAALKSEGRVVLFYLRGQVS